MCTRQSKAFIDPDGGPYIFGYEGVRRGLTETLVDCRHCPECQKNYYTDWATRGHRELLRWESSLFITATYNDEHLPENGSLDKSECQRLIKRIKKYFNSSVSNPIRQIYCGEYGTQATRRPHYHIILFNAAFEDGKPFRITDQGHQVYTSKTLNQLWSKKGRPIGNIEFGYATPASVAYLFKYILKKKSRKEKLKPNYIERDGVTYEVAHEFIEASRNPGIGAHLKASDSIKKGFLTVNGVRKRLPKYYLEHLREHDPATYDEISNLKFDFHQSRPHESPLRKKQKEDAQQRLTDTKKRL